MTKAELQRRIIGSLADCYRLAAEGCRLVGEDRIGSLARTAYRELGICDQHLSAGAFDEAQDQIDRLRRLAQLARRECCAYGALEIKRIIQLHLEPMAWMIAELRRLAGCDGRRAS